MVALDLSDLRPSKLDLPPPEIQWIDPCELMVDEAYQRGVGSRGLRLIKQIIENFDWRKFKPPTVVRTEKGLEIIDGQHSAIAAASHPSIKAIPIALVDAQDLSMRASAFIGINKDRLNILPTQLHVAGVVSEDATAVRTAKICAGAEIKILKTPRQKSAYKPRETVAVREIEQLIKRRGDGGATKVLSLLSAAGVAPVTAAAIKAVDFLLFEHEDAGSVDEQSLIATIAAEGPQARKAAGVFAAEHNISLWRGYAAVWFKSSRKRRPKAESASPRSASEKPLADREPSATVSNGLHRGD